MSARFELTLTRLYGPIRPRFLGVLFLSAVALFGMQLLVMFVSTITAVATEHRLGQPLLFALQGISFAAPLVGLRWLIGVRLAVGADGLSLRQMRSTRFIPYSEIRTVVCDRQRVEIRTNDGKSMAFMARRAVRPADVTELVRRVEKARGADPPANASAVRSLLARGERSSDAWLRDLRALTRSDGYRQVRVTPDDLWPLVEDPSLDVEERTAAAVALRDHMGEDEKVRVRIAADACARPGARVALEAAVDEDDDERLLRALKHD